MPRTRRPARTRSHRSPTLARSLRRPVGRVHRYRSRDPDGERQQPQVLALREGRPRPRRGSTPSRAHQSASIEDGRLRYQRTASSSTGPATSWPAISSRRRGRNRPERRRAFLRGDSSGRPPSRKMGRRRRGRPTSRAHPAAYHELDATSSRNAAIAERGSADARGHVRTLPPGHVRHLPLTSRPTWPELSLWQGVRIGHRAQGGVQGLDRRDLQPSPTRRRQPREARAF